MSRLISGSGEPPLNLPNQILYPQKRSQIVDKQWIIVHLRKVVVDLGAPFFIEKTCYLA